MSIDLAFAIKQEVRNNPVIRDVDPRERREFRGTLGFAALFVALLLFSAWQHVSVVNTGYALERLRSEEAVERSTNRRLRLELEMSQSPQQIRARAIRDLHMIDPAETLVIERIRAATPGKAVIAAVR